MKYLFLMLLLGIQISEAGNKIIYLISPPRCLSTAFMRSFEARKDFAIVNEPAWNAYNLLMYSWEELQQHFNHGFPILYPDVIQMVLKQAQTSHVLVKEISFSVEPFLMEDQFLIKNPDVHFIFLIRDPHASLISFAKKRFREIPLQKFGYLASYNLFKKIKAEGANPPLIICAEELSVYPHLIIQGLCTCLGIPFVPEALAWSDLGDNFMGTEWSERKDQNYLYHWHGAAIHSTGFKPLTSYAVDVNGKPTFAEVDPADLPEVIAMYDMMFPYYEALLQEIDNRIRIVHG